MAYESYNAYLSIAQSTSADYYKDSQQKFLDQQFPNAITYKSIQKLDRTTGEATSLNVRVVKPFDIGTEDKTYSDDYCQILFGDLDDTAYLGDMFVFDNYRWLTIETKVVSSVFKSCLVKRCNAELYFTASTPLSSNIITLYGVADVRLNDTVDEQYKITPKAYMNLQIPNSDNAKLIKYDTKRGTRFLLGNPVQAWQVVNIDSITNVKNNTSGSDVDGFIVLRLNQVQIHPDDDTDNMVAWQLYF